MTINPLQVALKVVNKTGNLLLSPPIGGGSGHFRNHGPRNQRKIALTFDDGPSKPCTDGLLDAMGELNVKGTFFCTGVNVTYHPDLLLRTFQEGHAVGNHSMAHRRKEVIEPIGGEHIDLCAEEMSKVIGCWPRLYRPPWGWLTPWEGQRLTKRGYTIIGWDVYTLDWQLPERDGHWIADGARRKTQNGSILLFHDAIAGIKFCGKKETIRAIQRIVPALRADGYEFVTIPELLNVPAYGPIKKEVA
jgi:peptidoglycan/xylan/chitin deacetylase (PgdA/CDA1 family)